MVLQGQAQAVASPEAPARGKEPRGLRIAFLEDDVEQAERVGSLLRGAGHHVHVFNRGRALLGALRVENFDLLLLDWELPDLSGYEVLRSLRAGLEAQTPVLFLTHRDTEADIVQALQAGADDFLVKPPRERELLARVDALGRRVRDAFSGGGVIESHSFRIDVDAREISRAGFVFELTRREFDVALLLFRNVGKVLSRGFIMDTVWGRGDSTTTRTVDMHVSRVRKTLGLSSAIGLRLVAIYGYGYRLERSVPQSP
jgi:DNA-binding response OmpR family regulator